MFKYNSGTLSKIEQLFREAGYLIRYEKGNFKAGYCILENKKVAVINKYYTLEAKINALMEILTQINIDAEMLSDKSRNIFSKVTEATEQNKEN